MSTLASANTAPRILLVEEDVAVIAELSEQLEGVGYTTKSTRPSLESVVAVVVHYVPDLILMRISLGDSVKSLSAAKGIGEVLDVPIVFLSSNSSAETVVQTKVAGGYGYVLEPFQEAHLIAVITTALDRHRRHMIRQGERLHQSLLARVLEVQPDGVIVFDDALEIVTMNGSGESMFIRGGSSPQRLKDVLPSEVLCGVDGPVLRGRAVVLRGAESFSGNPKKVRARRTDGESFPAELSLFVLPVMGKQHSVAIVRDLSEQERRQQQRVHALKLEAMGRLSSIVAHDFNNILGGLELQTERMQRLAPPANSELGEGLQTIRAAVHHGRALTRRLADLTRFQDSERPWTDLSDALTGLRDFLAQIVGDAIRVRWSLGTGLGEVQLAESELMQIVLNAATNSRAAMPHGGTFEVVAKSQPRAGSNAASMVLLELRDTGLGMSAELAEKAFEPFFTTKGENGSGLGLASIRLLAEDVGGTASIVSKPSMGTSVQVRLPARAHIARHGELENEESLRAAEEGDGRRILIVDDHRLMREALERTLRDSGYISHSVDSAGAALCFLHERGAQIDIMVTDLAMPMMNGHELCRVVGMSCPHIASIIMSGNPPSGTQSSDSTPWLQKPFYLAELETAVEQAIEHRTIGSTIG